MANNLQFYNIRHVEVEDDGAYCRLFSQDIKRSSTFAKINCITQAQKYLVCIWPSEEVQVDQASVQTDLVENE